MVALLAAAAATSSLRVGTLVLDNDYRHPVLLAKEAATLDVLSGGRLELGLGAGWLRDEYERAGLPFDPAGVRVDRLQEAIVILKLLLSGRAATFQGDHYSVADLTTFPVPVQRPHPPILVGAGSRRMLGIAGRHADIVNILPKALPNGTISEDLSERSAATVARKIEWVREAAGERSTSRPLVLRRLQRHHGDGRPDRRAPRPLALVAAQARWSRALSMRCRATWR
jgi:probable F420-dependent oxidoreductase